MGSQYVAQVPNVFPNIFSIASHFNPIPSLSSHTEKHRAWVVGAAIIISPGASPLLPYNCCSVPFKSAPALLLHLFLPPHEAKLLTCASLAIFNYCPSGLRGSFTTSSLYLDPVPNAHVCLHLTVHITKLRLQTIVPKPLYIRHFACIYWDPSR